MRVLISGAGVGGLALAVGLRRAGHEAVVFEKGPIGKLGSGLNLWANSLRALREIGVEQEVQAGGTEMTRHEFVTHTGRPIAAWPTAEMSHRAGGATVGVKRAELQQALANAHDPSLLRSGVTCVGYSQDGSGVTLRLADGKEERGDVLVGADGATSAVRAQLLNDGPPRYAGYVGYRAIIDNPPAEFPPGLFRLYYGLHGAWILFYHVGKGRLYWLALAKQPSGPHAAGGPLKEVVQARYADFVEPVRKVLEATPAEAVTRSDMVDRDPAPRWGEGRVTLLGDAAHPMTPNQGRGAGQALEDAVVLARVLAQAKDPVAALRDYERQRMARTAKLVLDSRAIGERSAWDNPIRARIRNLVAKVILRRVMSWQEQDMAYKF
jgi:2-polyprenyl-6-methoxyphenol hydroxylase-like FAD-dependent oxidoreductase